VDCWEGKGETRGYVGKGRGQVKNSKKNGKGSELQNKEVGGGKADGRCSGVNRVRQNKAPGCFQGGGGGGN